MRPHLEGGPRRHERAWLVPAWLDHLRTPLTPEARATLVDWFSTGRPAAVARGVARGEVDVVLGVTLPASRWLARLEFTVRRGAIARIAPPPLLSEAIPSAPQAWRDPLRALDAATVVAGVRLSVTGELAWQHVTASAYVTSASTVNLLFQPRTHRALELVLGQLRAREHWDGPRLGGEVVLGWDDCIAWRDLVRGKRRVLVRSAGHEAVADVERLLAGLR